MQLSFFIIIYSVAVLECILSAFIRSNNSARSLLDTDVLSDNIANVKHKHIHKGNNSLEKQQKERYLHLEKLGELYYQSQKVERDRKKQWAADFHILTGNYPCIRGVTPIGLETPESIEDGHKFGCGIHAISGPPIVYSFGSHKQQDFETAIKQLRPDSSIYTFELVADMIPAVADRVPGVQFFNIGLGYVKSKIGEPSIFKSFIEIMNMLNHTYVDVVKMDVEGYEWHWIHKYMEYISIDFNIVV